MVEPLNLFRVATHRQQAARDTHAQSDLLLGLDRGPLGASQNRQCVIRHGDGPVVPAAGLVEHPQRVKQLVQAADVGLLDGAPPRALQVPELGCQRIECGLRRWPLSAARWACANAAM